MAVKKNKQTEQEAHIKALTEENTVLRQTNHALHGALDDAGVTIAARSEQVTELAHDILAVQYSIGDLYARMTRVVNRNGIGGESIVKQGVPKPINTADRD